MSCVRLTQAEGDRLVNRLKNTNVDKFRTLCKMHLSFLLHLPGSSLEDFLGDGGTPSNPTAPPASTHWATDGSNKSRGHFRNLGRKKQSKDSRSPSHGLISPDSVDQLLPLLDFLSLQQNLSQEGLFRKSGHIGRQKILREKLQAGDDVNLQLEQGVYSAHDCANVLKSCLSDLTEPLLTDKLYLAHCQVSEMEQESKQLQTIQLLVQLLPAQNLYLLRCLLTLLHKVSSEPSNKMTCESLGTLFVPHLLVPRHTTPHDLHAIVGDLSKTAAFLIRNTPVLFKVPPALVEDIATYWSEMEETCTDDFGNPSETPSGKYRKRALPQDGAVSTSVTFADRQASQAAAEQTDTQLALAQLYAHVSSMPQSSKKRKLMKQFNKANGVAMCASPVPPNNRHKRTKSFGDSIKKMVGRNHKRQGSSHQLQCDQCPGGEVEHISFKPRASVTPTPATPVAKLFHDNPPSSSHRAESRSKPIYCSKAHVVDMKENAEPRSPVVKRQFHRAESLFCTPQKGAASRQEQKENVVPSSYLSPISRTIRKAPVAVQTSVMTPGSRTALAMLLAP